MMIPRRPLRVALRLLSILAVLSTAAAQSGASDAAGEAVPDPLDLASVMNLAVEASTDVRTARLDLASAERALARVESDPTSLRVPLLEARHAVEAAQDTLRNAEATARDGAGDAFAEAVDAEGRVAVAEKARDIARTEAEATRIRLEAGAATQSDVRRAEDAVRETERDVRNAVQARDLARDRLGSLLDVAQALPPLQNVTDVPDVGSVEDALDRLEENASLRSARRSVALAEAQLAATDVPFTTPPSEIEAARDRLETARLRADELARTLALSVRQAHDGALAAQGSLANAREQRATAREDVEVQEVRFEAGSIAAIELERSRLDAMRSETQLRAARHGLLDALRSLEMAILGAGP